MQKSYDEMNLFWKERVAQLSAHFPSEWIHWRVGSTNKEKKRGMPLAYIDARDAMDRLDDVVGPGGWRDFLDDRGPICIASVQIWCPFREEWVTKSDGAGATKFEPEKGKLSDAFKRAAVKWGVGRYLYGINSPWVDIETYGKSHKIVDREVVRLKAFLENLSQNPRPSVEELEDQPESEYLEPPAGLASKPEDENQDAGGSGRDRPSRPVTMAQAKALLAECRTIGEKHSVHGFEVCNWTLKQLDMTRPEGQAKYGDFLDHLCDVLGAGDFETFKQLANTFKPEGF